MFTTSTTVLFEIKFICRIPLVLSRRVVALLTIGALQQNYIPHYIPMTPLPYLRLDRA